MNSALRIRGGALPGYPYAQGPSQDGKSGCRPWDLFKQALSRESESGEFQRQRPRTSYFAPHSYATACRLGLKGTPCREDPAGGPIAFRLSCSPSFDAKHVDDTFIRSATIPRDPEPSAPWHAGAAPSVADLRQAVAAACPPLAGMLPASRFSVDQEIGGVRRELPRTRMFPLMLTSILSLFFFFLLL